MGKLKLNKKQVLFIGGSLIVVLCSIIGITKSKNVKASEIEEMDQYISSYKDEFQNYLLDEYEDEYNDLIKQIGENINEKNLEKAREDKNSLEDLKENVISKNIDIFNEKNDEISNMDISELADEKKQEINAEKDEINSLYSENKYRLAIEEISKLKDSISTSLDELKKQKEEEKKKQEEEEKKKNDEQEAANAEKEQTTKNSVNSNDSNSSSNSNSSSSSNNSSVSESYVSRLKVAQETNQLVIVKGQGGSDATVEFHVKDGNGVWKQVFSTSSYVGQAGITYDKHEGDRKTPAGVYSIGTGFGVASNPGANISYRVLIDNDYWVDDPNSKYYNKWVAGDVADRDWNSAEHMIESQAAYKYGIVINYNTYNTVKGKGSAIFLHCKTRPTLGCVSIPENYMISLLRQINSSARIVISPSEDEIYNF